MNVKKVPIEKVLEPAFRFVFAMARMSDRILRNEVGIGISQFRILTALTYHPNCSQKKIASFWDVTEASISRQIQNLLSEELITKTPNPKNQKSAFLNTSPKGKALLQKCRQHINRHAERTFNVIDESDRKNLALLLNQMFECVKKEVEI